MALIKLCSFVRNVLTNASAANVPHRVSACVFNRQYSSMESEEDEDKIEQLRDISRLPQRLRNRMNDRLICTDEEKNVMRKSLRAKIIKDRKLYAKYGKSSGINPGIMWPSTTELSDAKWGEKSFHYLKNMVEKHKKLRAIGMKKKEDTIAAEMAKMPALIEAHKQRIIQRRDASKKDHARQRALLEEAIDHFGYTLHPQDPQFKAFVDNKKEEERKAKKEMKKAQRAERILEISSKKGEPTKKAAEQ